MTETFVLLRPWWLLVPPALLLLAFWSRRRGAPAGGWERVMPPATLAAMRRLGHLGAGDPRAGVAALLAAGLVGIALAGPAVRRSDAPLLVESGAILIALDLSPSVAEGPALADAKAAAASVLAAGGGRPVGLLLYAGEAYEVAAPTADPAVLQSDVAVLGPGTMPGEGSRPAAGLALARDMLAGERDADVVLVTDGGGVDSAALAEAGRLTAAGVRLFVLTLDGAAGEGAAGDVSALTPLAAAVAPARAADPVLARLAAGGGLDRDPALTALRFRDLGPFVAGFAALPLLLLFARRR